MQSNSSVKIEAPEIVSEAPTQHTRLDDQSTGARDGVSRHASSMVWSSVKTIWSRDQTIIALEPVTDVLRVPVTNPLFMYLSPSITGDGWANSRGDVTGYYYCVVGSEPKPSLPLTGKINADLRQRGFNATLSPLSASAIFPVRQKTKTKSPALYPVSSWFRYPIGSLAQVSGWLGGISDWIAGLAGWLAGRVCWAGWSIALADGQERSGGLVGLQEARQ